MCLSPLPEVITLIYGDLSLNYYIYFCTRIFLDVFAIVLIIWIRIIGRGIYVKLLFIGSSMLIIGELVSNFYNGYIATIMANTGCCLIFWFLQSVWAIVLEIITEIN
jgi:hypothetical protein